MSTILEVENLSKQYRLGQISTGALSHDINRWWYKIRRKPDPYLKIGDVNDRSEKGNSEYVWALKNIGFSVNEGEVLGIIGKNGAGKSTLLKILSRVTGPSAGSVKAYGRIASLLEVGTGFHPELTGRENIYLNGAILGMTRVEITRKFDEIVDFSGCDKYIDTPVKRYSSGMYVRLAFAVAAHLEPEILIVDEVLAVGDAEFQKKAIGKMKDVSQGEGRTVLFVSHNMAAVKSLCTRGIILQNGMLYYDGNIDECVKQYLTQGQQTINYKSYTPPLTDLIHYSLHNISVTAKGKRHIDPILMSDPIEISAKLSLKDTHKSSYNINYRFKNNQGDYLFVCSSKDSNIILEREGSVKMEIPGDFFNTGTFFIDIMIVKNGRTTVFTENDILLFTVQQKQQNLGDWMGKTKGDLRPHFKWNFDNETVKIKE